MYKVCFVDDEIKNYQLFQKLVNWEEKGFEIVGTAADGVEALQMYENLHPDLIFMDIQLPLMDGLECVRCIREEDQDVQIVIVSAYGEFGYAQKAIRYGVQEFLLKPVSRIMLNQLVDKIKTSLDARKDSSDREDIFRNEKAKQLHRMLDTYEENVQEGTASFLKEDALIRIFFRKELPSSRKEEFCRSLLGDTLQEVFLGASVSENSLYVVTDAAHVLERIRSLADQLQSREVAADITYTTRFEDLSSFLMADNAGFYMQESVQQEGFACYAETELDAGDVDVRIIDALARQEAADLLMYVQSIFTAAKKQSLQPKILKNFVLDFLLKIKFALKKLDDETSSAILRSVRMEDIYHVYCAEELLAYVSDKVEQVFTGLDARGKHAGVVMQANAIAELSFCRQDFSVQDVIEQIGISKNYFISIYKEKTGVGFWEYVTQLRMERAKEQLLTTNETIAAIAQQTGYENEYYFSRKFKEYTGMSPKKFRQN